MVEKQVLEEIASSLEVPTLGYSGTMYIAVIQEGIGDMSEGRLSAEPLDRDENLLNDSRDIESTLHNFYELKYVGEQIGQLFIGYWPHLLNPKELVHAVEVALTEHPTDKVVVLQPSILRYAGVPLEPTKYSEVALAPPANFLEWKSGK